MERQNPVFIVVDGLTGSGKSTILAAAKQWVKAQGLTVFDLADWSISHNAPPTFQNVSKADVLFTFEPTKQWIGSAIREELTRTDKPYTGIESAHAFALDRLIQYRRLIIPALAANKIIIQDRSVSSAIAIQPILQNGPTLETLLAMSGNALALQHPPTDIILTNIEPEEAAKRLKRRAHEAKGVYELLDVLQQQNGRFQADWFAHIFTERGTTIHHINAAVPIEEMRSVATSLIKQILT